MFFKILLIFCLIYVSFASEKNHKYDDNEEVKIWVNKVGPYQNPQEKYEFYSLPFCGPEKREEVKIEGLGEALLGYELVKSNFLTHFKKNLDKTNLCKEKKVLTDKDVKEFNYAILNEYMFEIFTDDLPAWGLVGIKNDNGEVLLYTHYKFKFTYNENRIIEIKIKNEEPVALKVGSALEFSYSVQWQKSEIEFEHRFDKYLDNKFFEHQIHWFSIFNSLMMVVFLVGIVSVILIKTIRADYLKYLPNEKDLEENGLDIIDESGWKQVRGDVFRAPKYLGIFSALIGTGVQLVILALSVICISIGFYHNHPTYKRGSIVTYFVICYSFTSIIGGYASGNYYNSNGGKNWIRTMTLTTTIFPGTVFVMGFLINFVGIGYKSLAAIPFPTMVVVFLLWILVTFPLTFIGTILGRNYGKKLLIPPCHIGPFPKPIPQKPFYHRLGFHILLSGILPFGSIFIEMYFVFTSLYQYKYYYVFGFLLLVFIILNIVTLCVTIVSTYFLLNSEDYRWQWSSFLGGSSVGLYIFCYGIYFYVKKTNMHGLLQITYYFGYLAISCFGIGLMTGATGFVGCLIFVRVIYAFISKYD
jgi:transmembrane 9 superfamily protein 3